MYLQTYYDRVHEILDSIQREQSERIRLAGAWMADTIEKNGLVYVFGCGHSHMIEEELFYRAGGLAAICPIFETSTMLHDGAKKSSRIERMSGYAPCVIEQYDICEADVLIVSSSSGINPFPIEMAEQAKFRGARVIGITSENYGDRDSRDARGYHLSDMCDLVINNYVPCGDAVVSLNENLNAGPVSSISSLFIADLMMLACCERLVGDGQEPLVWRSGNVDGGDTYNEALYRKYKQRVKNL